MPKDVIKEKPEEDSPKFKTVQRKSGKATPTIFNRTTTVSRDKPNIFKKITAAK